jgi:hypothetical protein
VRVWIGLIWLIIRSRGRLLQHEYIEIKAVQQHAYGSAGEGEEV